MKTKRKLQKLKDREREVRKKILRKRAKFRAELKEEDMKQRQEREHQKDLNKFKTATELINKDGSKMSEEEVKERLAHNMEILKALDAEHEATLKTRQEMVKNPPPILNQWRQQYQEIEPVRNWGGSAGVEFSVNPEQPDKEKETPSTEEATKEEQK